MKYMCMLISVADINAARKFYEDLFGLEVFQDYGRNIAFTCGLALQQDFDWLVNLPKERVLKKYGFQQIHRQTKLGVLKIIVKLVYILLIKDFLEG